MLSEKVDTSKGMSHDLKLKLESEVENLKEQVLTLNDALAKDREIFMQESERLKT